MVRYSSTATNFMAIEQEIYLSQFVLGGASDSVACCTYFDDLGVLDERLTPCPRRQKHRRDEPPKVTRHWFYFSGLTFAVL